MMSNDSKKVFTNRSNLHDLEQDVISIKLSKDDKEKYGISRMSLDLRYINNCCLDLSTEEGKYKAIVYFSNKYYHYRTYDSIYGNPKYIDKIKDMLEHFSERFDIKLNRHAIHGITYAVKRIIRRESDPTIEGVKRTTISNARVLFDDADSFLIQIFEGKWIVGVLIYKGKLHYVPAWVVTRQECLDYIK